MLASLVRLRRGRTQIPRISARIRARIFPHANGITQITYRCAAWTAELAFRPAERDEG